jgi:hypothetical protein
MILPSVALQGMAGMGATPRKTRTITLDPIIIEGKAPAAGTKFRIPWGWVAIAGGLGGLYLLARWSKKKAGRRALA